MNTLHRLTRWTRCHLLGQCELPPAHPIRARDRLQESTRRAARIEAEIGELHTHVNPSCEPENPWVGTAFPPRQGAKPHAPQRRRKDGRRL